MEVGVCMYIPYRTKTITDLLLGTAHYSNFSRIIELFCQYLETARVSQFIQPIAYNAGQQPFLAMTLGSSGGSHRILVRLTHSLVLPCRTRHRTKTSSSLLSKPRSTWTCWPVTFRWPSINSARMPRRKYCYNQWRNSSSLTDQTSHFSAISMGSTDVESPPRSSKFLLCSGNVWLFRPHCRPKFSIPFAKDFRGVN